MLLFGVFPSGTTYRINNYSLGGGGTNSAASSTYNLQGSLGEQANGSATGTTDTGKSGSIQTEQLSLPLAPTISNGSGTYYNKLQVTLNDTAGSSNYATDVTFAISISTGSCTTGNYVQADGTTASTPVYQSYSTWGTLFATNLNPSTTYYFAVAAKEGKFTNTEFGTCASAATVAPSVTFSVSPGSLVLGSIYPGSSPTTSSNLTFGFTTNGASGGAVYVSGLNTGLHSSSTGGNIAAVSGSVSVNLALLAEGFGIQATNPNQVSGGPFATVAPFNGSSNNVGGETTSLEQILASTTPIVTGSANANVQAKSSLSDKTASDYAETLTFVAAGNF